MDDTFEKPLFKIRDGLMDLANWGFDKGLTDPERFRLTREARAVEVLRLANAGFKPGKIAKELRVDRSTVLRDLGLKESGRKAQKSRAKSPPPETYISPEIDDEDIIEERTDPRELPNSVRIRGLMNRANEAKDMAEADSMQGIKVTDELVETVREAAIAWMQLCKILEEKESGNG